MYSKRQSKNGSSEIINMTSCFEDSSTGHEKNRYRIDANSSAKYLLIFFMCFYSIGSAFALEYPKGVYIGPTNPYYIDFDKKTAIQNGTKYLFDLEEHDEYAFLMTLISATDGKITKSVKNLQVKYEVIPAGPDVIGIMPYVDPETLKKLGGHGGFGSTPFIRQRESAIIDSIPSIQNIQVGMSLHDVRGIVEKNGWGYNNDMYLLTSKIIKAKKDNKRMEVTFDGVGLLRRVVFSQSFGVLDCGEVWNALQSKYGNAATKNEGAHGGGTSIWKYQYGTDKFTEIHAHCFYLGQTSGSVTIEYRTQNAMNDYETPIIREKGRKLLSEITEKRNQKTKKLKSEKLDI